MCSSIGAVVLDVLALTQLQRAVPSDVLGRVWGALDALVVAAIIVGSVVVGPVVDLSGEDAAIVVLGLAVPALGLIGVGGLLRADRESVALMERIGPAVAVFEQVPTPRGRRPCGDRAPCARRRWRSPCRSAPTSWSRASPRSTST